MPLRPRADVTRRRHQKRGISGPTNRTHVLQKKTCSRKETNLTTFLVFTFVNHHFLGLLRIFAVLPFVVVIFDIAIMIGIFAYNTTGCLKIVNDSFKLYRLFGTFRASPPLTYCHGMLLYRMPPLVTHLLLITSG